MIYTVHLRRDLGSRTVDRVAVFLDAPDADEAGAIASTYRAIWWTVERVEQGRGADAFPVEMT